ncbi:hypothetical protein [Magnetospirillum sp. 15-1]|nr:hypothetical protein [Magnetospirillum sp. 15-1]
MSCYTTLWRFALKSGIAHGLSTTQRYIEVNDQMMRAAVENL